MPEPLSPITRRRFLQGVGGIVGAVALGACTGGGASGPTGGRPTVRIQGGTFGFPSPFSYTAAPGYWRTSYVYDTLLWPDSTGQKLPWLASRYERSEDGLVHRLELRDTSWHDGRPFTARDVAFTFEYFADKQIAQRAPLVIATPRNVAEVVEAGERTVEVRLEQPDANFEQAVLASVPIVPEHVWSTIDDPQTTRELPMLVGTGPYRLTSWDEAEGSMAFEANERFYLGRPFVRRIEMIWVDDEVAAVRAGQLDGGQAPVEGVRNDVLDPYRRDPAYGVISHETAFAFPLYWNIRRGGALADVRFRRACLMAIDREDLIQQLMTGNGTVGNPGFLPPGNPYHVDVDPYRYDVAGANRLLDEAGYPRGAGGVRQGPDGKPLRFTLYVHDTVPPALPELVASYLAKIGVEIERQIVDLVRLFGIKTSANYDMLINPYPGPVGTTPNGDPDILRPVFHSRPPNQLYSASGYSNPQLDDLLDRQVTIIDEAERRQVVGEIQRIVARDLPAAILYYTTMFFVFRRQTFDQWYYTPGGFGPGIPDAFNKHVFVTGRKTGLQVRRPPGG